MNAQENLVIACGLAIANLGPEEAYKRLRGGEGSVALTGLAAAKRADETGRAEDRERSDRPQSLAVSPGLAEAAIIELIAKMESHSEEANEESRNLDDGEHDEQQAYQEGMAHAYYRCAEWLYGLLPKPDSEQSENAGDGKPSQEPVEAGADSNCGTASGRRTLGVWHRDQRCQTRNPQKN